MWRAGSKRPWSRRWRKNAGAPSGSRVIGAWSWPAAWARIVDLRERLATVVRDSDAELYFPRTEFCTDNGAMIALAGCMRLAAGLRSGLRMSARANWET